MGMPRQTISHLLIESSRVDIHTIFHATRSRVPRVPGKSNIEDVLMNFEQMASLIDS